MIDHQTTLEAYFRDLLGQTLGAEGRELPAEVAEYLTRLCVDFARAPDLGDDPSATLAWLYRRAREAPPAARFEAYRRLGDVALVAPSLFAPYVDRRRALVGRSYYVQMGTAAYGAASELARSSFSSLLRELAQQFQALVDLLSRMAEATTLPLQRDLERLVARLVDSPHDPAAQRALRQQGLAPVWVQGVRA